MLFLPFSNSALIICDVNQMPVSKSMFWNLITILSSTCPQYHCAASLILTLTVPGVTRVTIDIILMVFERSCHWGPKYLVVSKSSEFNVNVSRHYFYVLQHQNCMASSDLAMLGFYFSLTVYGSIGGKFGFINLRSYRSKCFQAR